MPANLTSLSTALSNDPGLRANVSAADLAGGLLAAGQMNDLLMEVITAASLNSDGRITADDMQVILERVRADAGNYATFLAAHGDDEGNVETGFHLLQNDGGTLQFRGRNFVDTVADAIYHYGFEIVDGRYVNEDGNENELARDVAGWLNYFLNGVSAVYGTEDGETLNSGTYSETFAAARNEAYYGGGGNDAIWADLGNDTIFGGLGNDRSGGGAGADMMQGEAGNDSLSGEAGNDSMLGGDGNDFLSAGTEDDVASGGAGNDRIYGDAGNDNLVGGTGDDEIGMGVGNDYGRGDEGNDSVYGDGGNDSLQGADGNDLVVGGAENDWLDGGNGNDRVYGEAGTDRVYGGSGNDSVGGGQGNDALGGGIGDDSLYGDQSEDWMSGDAGNDLLYGGDGHDTLGGNDGDDVLHGSEGYDVIHGSAGNDTIFGGDGGDYIIGGAGRDLIQLWESMSLTDTIYFFAGDSGRTRATVDRIEGFESGKDRIDLRALGVKTFEDIDFSGDGASCYYDGRFLRIDTNGDRAAEMLVEIAWVDELVREDLILA